MHTYVAFLRGINVGGNHTVPMAKLKTVLEDAGFSSVRTVLNSGNLVFAVVAVDSSSAGEQLARVLSKHFSFEIPVVVRTLDHVQDLVTSNPFKGVRVTKETQLYVTFLPDTTSARSKIEMQSSKQLHTVRVTSTEVCSVLTLNESTKTPDLMSSLEKTYGKNITTRNWNTVVKIAAL